LSISDELPKGSFHEAVKGFKRELVRSALGMHGGNRLKAAKELGISRCYLHRLLNQLNVEGTAGEETELQEDAQAGEGLESDRLEVGAAETKAIERPPVFRSSMRIA